LDLVHPEVSGNKFFKLKYNLEEAKINGYDTILTFGGAYSNHIYATAKAAKAFGLKSIGIIRGDKLKVLNPTLQAAKESGMQLEFISREDYRRKNEEGFIKNLEKRFQDFYLIPEGGTNALAIHGTQEILQDSDAEFSHIACSIGTGGTFTGLALSIHSDQKLLGVSSLKGNFIHQEIKSLLEASQRDFTRVYEILDSFHFGGYAKYTPELIEFIHDFYQKYQVTLDPVYTGKTAFAILDLIAKEYFKAKSKILMIHTGGLQGNLGFTERTGINLPPSG